MFEEQFWEKDLLIGGMDEAGRGPLAGPVVVALVVFPPFTTPFLEKDSKKLSAQKREKLFLKIVKKALLVKVAFATPREIEKFNIYRATQRAYYKALENLPFKLEAVITDYMPLPQSGIKVFSPPKADEKYFSVAAASVVAKVVRDRIMELYAQRFPQYGFERHKGYPTKEHLRALETYGVSEIHRKTYQPIKKVKSLF